MIRICPKCGAILVKDTEKCSFCEVAEAESNTLLQPVIANEGDSEQDSEPEWRREVFRRLEEYRARRGRVQADDSQSGLPFQEVREAAPLLEEESHERRRHRPAQRHRQTERVEICIQPELDFVSTPDDRAHPLTALVPVATLAERRWAGALDALFLALTCGGFLGLFRSLGGQLTLNKMDAVVYLAIAYIFYGLYFFIFTALAGATPGMQIRGLTIVRLDGTLPDSRQLLWRSFGYLLSGATLMLGYLWALWDEDHFTWQDRISHTYVTAATPVFDEAEIEIPADAHTFARK